MDRALLVVILCLSIVQCKPSEPEDVKVFDIQGHRGCRGLMPENTLPAFQKALDLDVNTLELDLAISKDKKVLVSHEPYFRSGLSIDPDGNPVTKEDELNHNIFQMDYDSVKLYDVGSLPDPNHPQKENIRTYKPLLSEVIEKAEHYAFIFKKPLPDFNIEIKRSPDFDGVYHPPVEEFVDLVLEQVNQFDIIDNTIIQSFDPESLRFVKAKSPRIRTALLIMNDKSVEENLRNLGFKPDIYSCFFKLLNKESTELCQSQGIKVIPWTVNEIADMEAMIELGVDGIISDYPNRVIDLVRNQ